MKHSAPIFLIAIIIFASCRSDKRVAGTYVTSSDDTLRLTSDHSFRIEMTEPDTTKTFKITTGRWHRKGGKVYLNVDSRSMGPYWECEPMRKGLKRLRRPEGCEEGGSDMVFKKVIVKPSKELRNEYGDYIDPKKRRKEEKEKAKEKRKQLEEE